MNAEAKELLDLLKINPDCLNQINLTCFLDRLNEIQYEAYNEGYNEGYDAAETQGV